MKKIKNLKNVSKIWKIVTVLFVLIIGIFIASRYATAGTVTIGITGSELSSGDFTVGSEPVVWTASAYDSDQEEALDVSNGEIVWESSDRNIVDFTESAEGTESIINLQAVSAGKATITATYSRIVSTDDGDYEVTASTKREVVVKFKIDELSIPQRPYEDDWTVPNILTNSSAPVEWNSDNTDVIIVEDDGQGNGVVQLVGAGSTIVTATTGDGQSESFNVVVNGKFAESEPVVKVPFNNYYTISTNAVSIRNIILKSENPDIVQVEDDGTVKGVSAGRTNIFITAVDENHPWYSLLPEPARYLPVQVDLEIVDSSTIVSVGDNMQLKINVEGDNANSVIWTSCDNSVATIDALGNITAYKKGTTRINATMINEELFGTSEPQIASIILEVVDSFSLTDSEKIVNVGEEFIISALVTNESANVTWTSSDENVAKVATSKEDKFKGVVTGVSKGKATITATQNIDGVYKKAVCEVSVKEPVINVEIVPKDVEINVGGNYKLITQFTPQTPDDTSVTWISSDTSIVVVDGEGIITGVKGGKAVVSIVTNDGIKMASCNVTVREPVTDIQLHTNSITANMSQRTYQLTYKITPDIEGVNKKVNWTSSNNEVATVDENGLVTFVKPGKTTIIAKTEDQGVNGNLIDTCELIINNPVTSIELDYTMVTLKIGETFRMTSYISPEDASDKTITYTSSDTNVVTVDETGMLTAVGSGSATILAKANDGGATAMCNISVYQPVTSVNISNETMSVRKGTEFWLNAVALPENAMNKAILWASSDESIAKVDQNGKVTTIEAGTCAITATSKDSGVLAKCSLTVTQPITGIYLNFTNKTMMKGDSFPLIPTVTPLDADNRNVIFTSSDPSVATVSESGVVTGIKGGKVVIIAKTEERGLVASCLVNVMEFVTSVNIDGGVSKLNVGMSVPLSAKVLAESATNKKLSWSSSNPSVVQVDQMGRVTAISEGTVTIYANATDGSGIFGSTVLTVIRGVTSIAIEPAAVTLYEGNTANLSAKVYPENSTYRNVEWSSTDTNIAIVGFNGEVTAVSAGICKVIAKSSDGNEVIGECRVTVKKTVPATEVVINSKNITMLPGQTRGLNARIKPSRSTEGIRWYSGDTSIATVSSDGVVTARGQGITDIVAVSTETGLESTCEVVVLALNATYITLEQYDSFDLDVFGATEGIKWYSNNKRVATVSASGEVIGRMAGITTITAKVNGKILYCTVRVTNMD